MQERLRIAIDGTPLLGERTGVGQTVVKVVEALARRDDVEPVVYGVMLRGRREFARHVPIGATTATRPIPARVAWALWQRVSTPPIEVWTGRVDVVHGTNYVAPPARAPAVVSVYDLTFV